MSLAAIACGADGLAVEVHPCPDEALCDGAQSMTPELFATYMKNIRALQKAMESMS
jgi:3-deoxy-7-phosphoheptulonate synthase